MTSWPPRTHRRVGALAGIVGAAGVPQGYTLTIWAASMVLVSRHGIPRLGEIVLFLIGARFAYAVLRGASDGVAIAMELHDTAGALCQGVALAAVMATTVACAQLPGWTGWAPGAFFATLAYFTAAATCARDAAHRAPHAAGCRRRPITIRRSGAHVR